MYTFRRIVSVLIVVLLVGSLSAAAQEVEIELTQTHSSVDGRISFQYPQTWHLEALSDTFDSRSKTFSTRLTSGESVVDHSENAEVDLSIQFGRLSFLVSGFQHPDFDITTATPADFVAFAIEPYTKPSTKISPITLLTVGDYNGAEVSHDFTEDGKVVGQLYTAVFELDDDVRVILSMYTPPGKRHTWIPTVLAIVESIRYQPEAEAAGYFVSEGGEILFNYPEEWVIDTQYSNEFSPGIVTVATSDAVLYAEYADDFASGDVQFEIGIWPQEAISVLNIHSLQALLQQLMSIGSTVGSFSPGSIEDTTVNDWPALGVDVTPQSNQEVKFLAYQPQDDLYITLVLHTAPGELDQWLPTALAIAESITYSG